MCFSVEKTKFRGLSYTGRKIEAEYMEYDFRYLHNNATQLVKKALHFNNKKKNNDWYS